MLVQLKLPTGVVQQLDVEGLAKVVWSSNYAYAYERKDGRWRLISDTFMVSRCLQDIAKLDYEVYIGSVYPKPETCHIYYYTKENRGGNV